ncbi:hypothetical protein Ocepr_0800 [Oceanithermus profundus DSM 14977]|uniref:Uncharacterized protein n=1 Tax=Oceanithermus profundus (strain DSM 14977 / NBRC 100410 / VKM B-2274 / 506) TaxID=670487 RepID=E4U7C8_OCEP5|nr:hypothetical protein Ocepr_0800 [Oceanithermus profundus DSM 14977]
MHLAAIVCPAARAVKRSRRSRLNVAEADRALPGGVWCIVRGALFAVAGLRTLWRLACGSWWASQRQRNLGCSYGMDPGSSPGQALNRVQGGLPDLPPAIRLGRPGNGKTGGRRWGVGCRFLFEEVCRRGRGAVCRIRSLIFLPPTPYNPLPGEADYRAPCRAQTTRFGHCEIMLPPLGEGWGGGCWRQRSHRPSFESWPTHIPPPTPCILKKQPPSGLRPPPPRGRFSRVVIRQKRSAHRAFRSGFQLAQAKGLLGWNDELLAAKNLPPLGEGRGGGCWLNARQASIADA